MVGSGKGENDNVNLKKVLNSEYVDSKEHFT